MKRILFVILLVLLPSVFAAYETKVYSGWVESGKNKTFDSDTFRVEWIREQNKTIIYLPDNTFMQIYPEKDPCSLEGFFSICQTQQKFYLNGKEVPPDITSKINASLYLFINKTDQGLNITKKFEKIMYANISTKVKVVVTKLPGTKEKISSIYYNDSFSNDFFISNINGCKKVQNSIVFMFDEYKSSITCEYDITPIRPIAFTNNAVLSYVVFEKIRKKTISNNLDIKDLPIKLTYTYQKALKIGDGFIFNVSYATKQNVSLKSLLFLPSKYLKVKNISPNLKLDDGVILYDNKSKKTAFFALDSTFSGIHNVSINLSYYANGKLIDENAMVLINYSHYMFDIELFGKDGHEIIRVSNGAFVEYFDVILYIDNTTYKIGKLPKRTFREFEAYNSSSIKTSFRTEYGQLIYHDFLTKETKEYVKSELEETKNITSGSDVISVEKRASPIKTYYLLIIFFSVVGIIYFITRPKKSNLDEEIKELQKANFK